ncbi:MAG TPA: pyruvate, phosphate dikinase [Sporichthyaceae bacterium]|nr:pyruvate, phosphate dikinase [Sporichthyaceae bacterium]
MTHFVHDVRSIDPADSTRFGGKATGLARMNRLGLPVPPAFVIDTDACRETGERKGRLPDGLAEQVGAALAELENGVDRSFSVGTRIPLLVSVRSGAKVSMPGMMDTILNLGLHRGNIARFAMATGSQVAVDCWLRFWAMYADIVLDVDPELLREGVEAQRAAAVADLSDTTAAAFEDAVLSFLEDEGAAAPADPRTQLDEAIGAVFRSWDSRRAKTYRAHHGIPDDLGTAVVVQVMVFGNAGPDSGSGVAFTRDPKTGVAQLYGEYLPQGQGEEVVAGTRTPVDLAEEKPEWADLRRELLEHSAMLEAEYRDALDIEFTVQDGTLYLLQVRPAKRTAAAAVRIATDLLAEGTIDPSTALGMVTADQVRRLVSPQFSAAAMSAAALLTTGIAASPGHGSGQAVLDADRAATLATEGHDVVLVRPTTSPQDLRGMLAATAVLTARGGATSHAAVVSRALDKPCVVGASEVDVRPDEQVFIIDGVSYPEGTELSVDGATGKIYAGLLPRAIPDTADLGLADLLGVADRTSGATVWLPAASPQAIAGACGRGASGIAVVGLTDLMAVVPDAVARLVSAIEALSTDPNAPAATVEQVIATDVRACVAAALTATNGLPIDIRLPVFTSPRARQLIDEWAGLAPHLLLPLGPRRLLVAWLEAIAGAVADTGHPATTVLLGGVTSPSEVAAFAELAADVGLACGAVLSNPTILFDAELLTRQGHTLWVDLHELTRCAHGYPEELLFTVSELTAAGGTEGAAPGTALNPLVRDLLGELVVLGGGRIGVDLAGASPAGIAPELYRLGFRTFTASIAGAEELRLLLGQAITDESGGSVHVPVKETGNG